MYFLPKLPRIGLELEGRPLCAEIAVASSFGARMRGLILAGPLEPGYGLLITPCNSVHMFGMREPIEAVFLSKELRVLKISPPLKPWRSISVCLDAWAVLEWHVGQAAYFGLYEGSQLKRIHVEAFPLME